jgi:hypothetical protein
MMWAVCTSTFPALPACSVLDFAIGDNDAAFHLAVTQPGQHDLLANLLAELGPGDAVAFQRRAKLLQGESVAFGDPPQRSVELDVGNPQSGFLGELKLYPVGDHPFQQLLFQDGARGQLHVLGAQLAFDNRGPGAQLIRGYGFIVDYGDDSVDLLRLGSPRLGLCREQEESEQQKKCR